MCTQSRGYVLPLPLAVNMVCFIFIFVTTGYTLLDRQIFEFTLLQIFTTHMFFSLLLYEKRPLYAQAETPLE